MFKTKFPGHNTILGGRKMFGGSAPWLWACTRLVHLHDFSISASSFNGEILSQACLK